MKMRHKKMARCAQRTICSHKCNRRGQGIPPHWYVVFDWELDFRSVR